jgi:hypothetical protein
MDRLTAKSRVKNVIWCDGLSVMLSLQVQIWGDVGPYAAEREQTR